MSFFKDCFYCSRNLNIHHRSKIERNKISNTTFVTLENFKLKNYKNILEIAILRNLTIKTDLTEL